MAGARRRERGGHAPPAASVDRQPKGEPVQEQEDASPQERLLQALLDGNAEEFERLLGHPEVRAEHKYGNPHYSSCLEIACRRVKSGPFVRALLKTRKVKPNINHIIPEPIHYAAKVGSYEALEALLQHKKLDVNAADSKGDTALHYLAQYFEKENADRYVSCVKLLVDNINVDVNKANKKGFTPIHHAAFHERREMVLLLLKSRYSDLDLDGHSGSGRTARMFLSHKYPELVQELPPIKYSMSQMYKSPLLVAFQNQHLEVFRGLLRQVDTDGTTLFDPNLFYKKPLNATCLEMACKTKGYKDFVKALLEAGADPNLVNQNTSMAPIHVASATVNHEVLHVLLEEPRTNIYAVDCDGWTGLHHAALAAKDPQAEDFDKNRKKCLELLLDKMQIADYDDPQQKLLKKATTSKTEMLGICNRLLHQQLCSLRTVKEVLFECLYKRQESEFISKFREHVKDDDSLLQCQDKSNFTFVQLAVKANLAAVLETLLQHGASVQSSHNKRPPLILAAKQRNREIIQLLLDKGNVHIDDGDMKGNSALYYTIKAEDLESTIILLQHGASLDKENVLGKTPLTTEGFKALLDKSLKTNDKYFPRDDDYEVIFDYTLLTANHYTETSKVNNAVCYKRSPSVESVRVDVGDGRRKEDGTAEENEALNDAASGDAIMRCLQPETELLHYISREYKRYKSVLDHPIINSFLQFKWDCVKVVFYVNLLFFVLYFVIINCFIVFHPRGVCKCTSNCKIPDNTNAGDANAEAEEDVMVMHAATWILLLSVVIVTLIREAVQCFMSPLQYIKNYENLLDVAIIIISWVLLLSDMQDCLRATLNVVVILLSSIELLALIGRCPKFSHNIEMLKEVSKSYIGFLASYVLLIFAFAHCLFIVFREDMVKDNMSSVLWALSRTIVFMTGEYEANTLNFETMPLVSVFVFIMFVFFISIVLLNLLIGLSVNDTKTIQDKSQVLCVTSRIHIIYEIEMTILQCYKSYKKLFPHSTCFDKYFQFMLLFPTENKQVTVLPNNKGIIKENPFKPDIVNKMVACLKREEVEQCKVNNNTLEEAMKIISNSQITGGKDKGKRVENWENSLTEILEYLKGNSGTQGILQ